MKLFPDCPSAAAEKWFSSLEDGKCTPELNKALKEKLETRIGQLEKNQSKNRYSSILPYDSSRVVLSNSISNEDDYINACYLQYPNNVLRYIATQAPLPNTTQHFWRMVILSHSPLILVLTKEMEGTERKLHPYWPSGPNNPIKLNNAIEIRVASESYFKPDIIIAKLQIFKKESLIQEVIQLRYEGWPDQGIPSNPKAFLSLRETFISELLLAKEKIGKAAGPPIIHCSAGVGRTGTFCTIDTILSHLDNCPIEIDIVVEMINQYRQQRMYTVETSGQFSFIYKVVNSFIKNDIKEP